MAAESRHAKGPGRRDRRGRGGSAPGAMPPALGKVYEDDDLVVVDKPAGLLSSPLSDGRESSDQPPNVFDILKRQYPGRGRGRERERGVWIIHRLDAYASGLMVFAKSARAFEWLKAELKARRIGRVYVAVVEGEIERGPEGRAGGTVRSLLREESPGRMRRVREEDEGLAAITHWRLVGTGKGRSLVECRLETGRKNQIRVHMRQIGHPIVGDVKYGNADPGEEGAERQRLCLHAAELSFAHPATGEMLHLRSRTPRLFERLLGRSAGTGEPPVEPVAAPSTPTPARGEPPVGRAAKARGRGEDGSWEHVAEWYDRLIDERGSDHHERVILPGTVRLLAPRAGERVLDVACGQGVLCRGLAELGCDVVGIDASPSLIARARSAKLPRCDFRVHDARELDRLDAGAFDAASCAMALMNIEPLEPVTRGVAACLKPGGRFVGVILHPAFRAPGQTSWGWDDPAGDPPRRGPRRDRSAARQYRRIDGYLSSASRKIVMNPGEAASGGREVVTWTYHRPIEAYVRALADAGLLVEAMEEWPSTRVSQPGPRAPEENRARREIPLFLAIRAVKVARDPGPGGGDYDRPSRA
ncbi:MAG: methyltransferase domain-containing protein [Phycisphaerae bacterium]|nr:methyltransferase domain-containing protein [Phycisphaerae bacterium]